MAAAAFAIDAAARPVLAVVQVTNAGEPVYFIPRLITFSLLALSIVGKKGARLSNLWGPVSSLIHATIGDPR